MDGTAQTGKGDSMTWNQRQIRRWNIEFAVTLAALVLVAMWIGGLIALRVEGVTP